MSINSDPAREGTAPAQQIRLPDSLMRAITVLAGDGQSPPVAILHAAILITYGYALYARHDTIDPTTVTIPTAQWTRICEALLEVPSRSGLEGVNLGLDWVNLGPAAHDAPTDGPQPVALPPLVEAPEYPVALWQDAVAAGKTRCGYAVWVAGMRGLHQAATRGATEADSDE